MRFSIEWHYVRDINNLVAWLEYVDWRQLQYDRRRN